MSTLDDILLNVSLSKEVDAGIIFSAASSIVKYAQSGLAASSASIWLMDSSVQEISCFISEPESESFTNPNHAVNYAACPELLEHLEASRYIICHGLNEYKSSSLAYLSDANIDPTLSVIDCPIRYDGELIGLLRCESNEERKWDKDEGRFLANLADMVGRALLAQRWQSAEGLLQLANRQLEKKVESRTNELSNTLEDLYVTQAQLVESEKMAALGGLVAGIAHEINTPLGICITSISHIKTKTEQLEASFLSGEITEEDLTAFLKPAKETLELSQHHLQRTANLVKNFKQIAVDQSIDETSSFNLHDKLESLIISFRHELKVKTASMLLDCPRTITMTTFPGALDQVITNLTMNTIHHGFADKDGGSINIEVVEQPNDTLCLKFSDNGCGIPEENRSKIFDPFFTTRRYEGGTGLGLNILYNLITHKMLGTVSLSSRHENGATFVINLPKKIDAQERVEEKS